MDQRLRRTMLLFPWLVSALVLGVFSTHPVERTCDDSLTSGDHAYLTSLRLLGGAVALATLVLLWLLARRRRDFRKPANAGGYSGIDAVMALTAVLIIAGLSLHHPLLLVPFLLAGYLSVVFLVGPLAVAAAYVSAIKSSVTAQQFVNRALIFYVLSLALVIPGVFALLALRISPICLN